MFNSKSLRVLYFIFLFSFNFLFGMLPGTRVLTASEGHKNVEDLEVGDLISIYSIRENGIEEELKIIERVQIKQTRELVEIKTRAGISIYGPDQKIYNRRIFKFVRAKELRVGDILFSPELRNLEIEEINIKTLRRKIGLYYISIEDRCLFLALMDDESNILVHDEPLTMSLWDVFCGSCDSVITSIYFLGHYRQLGEF